MSGQQVQIAPKAREWLAGLVPGEGGGGAAVVSKSDAARKRLAAREQVLKTVFDKVEPIKQDLIDTQKSLKIKKGGKTLSLLNDDLNPDEAIDVVNDSGGDSELVGDAGKIIDKLYKLRDQLLEQQTVLREAKTGQDGNLTDGQGEPLFTEAEIRSEFWTPLVREGVVPEGQVIKRYSDMARIFEGAQQSYAERLEAYSSANEPETEDGMVSSGLGNLSQFADVAGKGVKAMSDIIGELPQTTGNRAFMKDLTDGAALVVAISQGVSGVAGMGRAILTAKDGQTIGKAFATAVKGGCDALPLPDLVKKMLPKLIEQGLNAGKFKDKIVADDKAGAVDIAADMIGAIVETIGKQIESDPLEKLGNRLKGAIKSTSAAVQLYQKRGGERDEVFKAWEAFAKEAGGVVINELKNYASDNKKTALEEEKEKIKAQLQPDLDKAAKAIEQATGICLMIPDLKNFDEDIDTKPLTDYIAKVDEVSKLFDLAVKKTTELTEALRIAEQVRGRLQELDGMARNLTALSQQIEEATQKAQKNKDERNKEDDDEDEDEDEKEDSWEKVGPLLEQLKAAKGSLSPEDAMAEQVEAGARQDKAEADKAEFAKMLQEDFTAPVDGLDENAQQGRLDMSKLDKLIAQMKGDKAKLKMLSTFAQLGVKGVTVLFEQLGPVADAVETVNSLRDACERYGELLKWKAMAKDSMNAGAFALVAAQLNRAGLDEDAYNEANFKALTKFLQTVGKTMKVTGFMSLQGAIIGAGGTVLEIGKKALTDYYSKQEMEGAWKAYVAALESPDNRKLQREALRKNATLAKYAVAWAATEGHDRMARDAMTQCGLTPQVLEHEDTNAHKVVEYLETLFDTDPVVLKASPSRPDWWPGPPELTSRSWIKFLAAAAAADPPLERRDAVPVTRALVAAETKMADAEKAPDSKPAVTAANQALTALIDVAGGYRPTDTEGAIHKSAQTYVDAIAALAEQKRRHLPVLS